MEEKDTFESTPANFGSVSQASCPFMRDSVGCLQRHVMSTLSVKCKREAKPHNEDFSCARKADPDLATKGVWIMPSCSVPSGYGLVAGCLPPLLRYTLLTPISFLPSHVAAVLPVVQPK